MKSEDIEAQAERLRALLPGWDGHIGNAIDPLTLAAVLNFMGIFDTQPTPWLVPCPPGGVQVEFRVKEVNYELEFLPDGKIEGYWEELSD